MKPTGIGNVYADGMADGMAKHAERIAELEVQLETKQADLDITNEQNIALGATIAELREKVQVFTDQRDYLYRRIGDPLGTQEQLIKIEHRIRAARREGES